MDTCERDERRAGHVFILIFVLLAAGIVTTGYLYYRNHKERHRVEVERQISAIAELKVGELVQWRQERLGDADSLFKNVSFCTLVRRFFEKPEDADAQRQLLAWISKYEAHYQYDRVFLLDAQGVVRMSAPEALEPDVPHLAQDAAEVLRSGKVAFLDFHRAAPDRPIHLAVLVPILDDQDGSQPLGVLVLRIDPQRYLYPFISRWPTPSRTAETLLIRRDGNDAVFLNELRFRKNTALTLRCSLESKDMPAVKAALGQEGIVEGVDYRGEPVIADVRAVPDSPWFLVARIDISEVYAPVKQLLWLMVVLVGALLLGAGAAVGFVWRHQSARFYRERYEAAEALRGSRESLSRLIETTPAGITFVDGSGRITFANPAAERILGLSRSGIEERVYNDVRWKITDSDGGPFPEEQLPFALVQSTGKSVFGLEHAIEHPDGQRVLLSINAAPLHDPQKKFIGMVASIEDITERKQVEGRERFAREVLDLLNRQEGTTDTIRDILQLVKKDTGIEAVGIRLQEGDDFPYYETNGFTEDFVQAERYLCERDAAGNIVCDGNGNPVLECMCGTVLRGRTDATLPFFTENGSFWTNSTTKLLASTTEKERRGRTRNRCNGEGYESVALIPLRSHREIIGLFQLNDCRPNRFTPDMIRFFEGLGASIGIALARKRTEEALRQSEARFRSYFDMPLHGIAITSAEKAWLQVNDRICSLLGYTQDELVRMTWAEITHPDDLAADVEQFNRLLSGEIEQYALDKRFIRKDGREIWTSISVGCVWDSHGNVDYIVGLMEDITDRKRAEEALRETKEHLEIRVKERTADLEQANRALQAEIVERKSAEEAVKIERQRLYDVLETLPAYVILLSEDYRVPFANRFFRERFGKSEGRHCYEYLFNRAAPCENCEAYTVLKTAAPHHWEWTGPDGRNYDVFDFPFTDTDGAPLILEMGIDITERRRAQLALTEANESLERRVAERTTELRLSEAALRHQNEVLQDILGNIPVMIAFFDREGRHQLVNRCWQSTLGWSLEEMQYKDVLVELYPDPEYRKYVVDYIAAAAGTWGDFKTRTHDGRVLDTSWINVLLLDGSNIGIGIDITERKRAEEERRKLERQLQQTQKLESLGVLAGGIAHDFNNILMVVLGYAELALSEISPMSAARQSITQITLAGRRAAELCHQMLAYAGKASFALERMDLRELIEEMAHLLKTSISKKAILNLHLERGLPPIEADPSQIRQIVMNLIVNASEAIGDKSGVITVSTGATRCDEAYLRKTELCDDLAPGLYVYLEVADTGCGMDAETRTRIFEPFFSTKFAGRGLGLAAVMGIVRAHKGALKVYSEPGKGTTFKILFPALETGEEVARAGEDTALAEWRGKGTVLLADDEESVRAVGARILERLGFTVLTVADGREAVALYRERGGEIVLVVLDLTMPHMDGAETFGELRRINPDVRVILASGYGREDVASRFAGKGLAGVLQKPYTRNKLKELLAGLMPPPSPSE